MCLEIYANPHHFLISYIGKDTKLKELCKETGFTTGVLKGALAEDKRKNVWPE